MQFNEYTRQLSKYSKSFRKSIKWFLIALANQAQSQTGLPHSHLVEQNIMFHRLCCMKGGLLDTKADDTEIPKKLYDGRVQCLYETLTQPWEKHEGSDQASMEIGEQEIEYLSNIMTFMQTEALWHMVGRPYYNLYPIVYEHMIKGIDLNNYTWENLAAPWSPLLLKFPVGHEPYGISTLMVRKHHLDQDVAATQQLSDGSIKGYSFRAAQGFWYNPDEIIEGRSPTDHCNELWVEMMEMSKNCQLEIEIQFRHDLMPRMEAGAITLSNTKHDTKLTTALENSELRDLEMEQLFNAHNTLDRSDLMKVNRSITSQSDKIGGTIDYTGNYPDLKEWHDLQMVCGKPALNRSVVEKRKEFHEFMLKLVVLLSEIHKTPGIIEDAILERDRKEYADANELRKKFLVDRASRRNGHSTGYDVGREQQEQSDNSKGNPHWVDPFLRNQACGPRHSERKLIIVTGHMRGVAELEKVPTGFEGDEQPKQPEYKYRPPISPALRAKVLARDKYTCRTCGRKPKDGVKLEAGHIISDKNGGKASLDNLITQCDVCNRGQSSRNINKESVA